MPEERLRGLEAKLDEALRELRDSRNENRALRAELTNLDVRMAAIERSVVFRGLRAMGLHGQLIKRKAGQALLRSGLHPIYAKLMGEARAGRGYEEWLKRHRGNDPLLGMVSTGARISVLMPTRRPRLEWLQAAVESVVAQTHRDWQLCICVDGEADREVEDWLAALARDEERVRLSRTRGEGISAALNAALAGAMGEYVAFLDHDDLLEPTALAHVSRRVAHAELDLLYSDEGYIDEGGEPLQPNFKPGWSPELLLNCMYMGHLLVARRRLVEQVGGFRPEVDGAQDYDLVLRLVEQGARVGHVPRILYHWRRHEGSTASGGAAKPYAWEAGRKSLEAAVTRRGWPATVRAGELPNGFRVEMNAGEAVRVSIIVPSRSAGLLGRCLSQLHEKTDGMTFEVMVVHHLSEPAEDARISALAAAYGTGITPYSGPFDFATMCNDGARASSGDVLVFLNDDVEPQDPDWLRRMVGALQKDGVGVAGARLLYPQGSIQHVGMVLGMAGTTGHLGRHLMGSSYWPWIEFSRDVSAVTGACLAVRRSLFEALGGFDAAFPVNYNDVDLCLRAREAGFRVVVETGAVLVHRESLTRRPGTSADERLTFHRKWGHLLETADEYFTPNLRRDVEDLSLAD